MRSARPPLSALQELLHERFGADAALDRPTERRPGDAELTGHPS
jgi:hypothetical protein